MGLIGGLARTAAIAGTATAVSNRVSRRQARRWSADEAPPQQQYGPPPQQQYGPPPQQQYGPPSQQYGPPSQQYGPPPQQYGPPPQQAPAAAPDAGGVSAQLERLADMKTQGLLTDEEFAAAKAKLLGI
jgi:hypothetical protein